MRTLNRKLLFSIIFLGVFFGLVPLIEVISTNTNSVQTVNWSISWSYSPTVKQDEKFEVYDVKVTNKGTETFFIQKFLLWIDDLNTGSISYPQNAWVREFDPEIEVDIGQQETIISTEARFRIHLPKNFQIGTHYYTIGLQIDNDWTWIGRPQGDPSFEVTRGIGKVTCKNPKIFSGKGTDIIIESSKNTLNTSTLGDYTISIELDTTDSCPLGDVKITAQTSNTSWDDEDEIEYVIFYDSEHTYNEIANDTITTIEFSFNLKTKGAFDIRIDVTADNLQSDVFYLFHFNIKGSGGGIPGFTTITTLSILNGFALLVAIRRKKW